MSTDSPENETAGDAQVGDSTRSVRARVNDACVRQLEADDVMDVVRRNKLRALFSADKPPKADEFVTLFQEQPAEAVK